MFMISLQHKTVINNNNMNNKRLLTVIFIGLLVAAQASAQRYGNYQERKPQQNYHNSTYTRTSRNGTDLYYGLRLGLALSTVNSDISEWDGPNSRASLNIGAVLGVQLTKSAPVFFETGLFYTQKGGRQSTDGDYGKLKINMNYIEVPLLLKYEIEIDDEFSIQPLAGGFLALGVGGSILDYTGNERSNWKSNESFSKNKFKRFDGGLRIGCGAQYQILYAELAYDFGLANVGHDEFESTHNGTFYINLGVNF